MNKVEIAILSYNEAKSLPAVVNDLNAAMGKLVDVEFRILVVNNGSKDETPEVVYDLEQKNSNIRHITIEKNLGYGFGVKSGLSALQGDIVGYMWGDNQFDASIVADLVKKMISNKDLHMTKTYRKERQDGNFRLVVSGIYQAVFQVLYGFYTIDINSGPKIFRAEFLSKILPLKSDDWFVDAEIMIKASRLISKNEITELPIVFRPRKFGRSNVRFIDCFQFLYNLLKYRFVKL
jgi:glycosyltransferase involved in cell wall biosynthesis